MSNEPVLSFRYDVGYQVGQATGRKDGCKEERARIRAMAQRQLDECKLNYGGSPTLQAYDKGRIRALRDVLFFLQEDTPHEG